MAAREDTLNPIYHQIAVTFADLHDTPGRMQEKGCINVSCALALSLLFLRLLRLLSKTIFSGVP